MPIFAGPPEPVVEASPAPAQENPCSFRASLYGWMQSLDGTVGVRGIESDVNIPFKDIVDDLNFGAMGVPRTPLQTVGHHGRHGSRRFARECGYAVPDIL